MYQSNKNTPRNTHMDPLYKSLRIMKFNEIRKFELCKLAYSLKEKLLLKPILEMFHNNKRTIHQYPMRHKKIPIVKKNNNTKVTLIIKVSYVKVLYTLEN